MLEQESNTGDKVSDFDASPWADAERETIEASSMTKSMTKRRKKKKKVKRKIPKYPEEGNFLPSRKELERYYDQLMEHS